MLDGTPTLKNVSKEKAFGTEATLSRAGVASKTVTLMALMIIAGAYTWAQHTAGNNVGMLIFLGVAGGLVAALFCIFAQNLAPIFAPIYAVLEGLALGGISSMYEKGLVYHTKSGTPIPMDGIVLQAVVLTLACMGIMWVLYTTRLIRVTPGFMTFLLGTMGAILFYYLFALVASSFFGYQVPLLHDNGWPGILFSAFVCSIAALNFIVDFDMIDQMTGVAPRRLEWYCAFSLMLTLVWLYLEILRLLSKLRSK